MGEQTSLEFYLTFGDVLLHKLVQMDLLCCFISTIYVTEKVQNREPWLLRHGKGVNLWDLIAGTGPLACLSLSPVADLDKVSND